MEKILTFIIPAYNSEKYLSKCLDSFLDESFINLIEIIVVNDGSVDQTFNIADSYRKRYPDSFRIVNKENGGHGSAINQGAAIASGNYFKVIDADDWILTSNLKKLLPIIKNKEADVIILPYHTIDLNTGERNEYGLYDIEFDKNYTLSELVIRWRSFENGLTFHGIIYKTDFYREKGIQLIEKVFYEDHEYATIPLCRAHSICPIDIPIYEYLIGNSQQSVSQVNQVKRLGHMEAVIKHMLAYYKNTQELLNEEKELFVKKFEAFVLTYYKVACLVNPDRRGGRERSRQYCSIIGNSVPKYKKKFSDKYKLYCLLSLMGLDEKKYEKLLNSKTYRKIRKKKGN